MAAVGAGVAAPRAAEHRPPEEPTPLIPPTPVVPAGAPERKGVETEMPATTTVGTPAIQGIEVNPLAEIAPDSIGILDPDDGGFGVDMWAGTDRYVVERLLPRLPGGIGSRSLRDLARRLLLSIATPPAPQGPGESGETTGLLALRVDRLAALGEIAALNELLAVVPSRQDDESMARARLDGLLLAHNVDEACRLVRNAISAYHEVPYWPKALVFCQMVAGEVDQMMLGLDLLREQGMMDDPAFFALAGGMSGGEAEITEDAELSPLHLAMLRVMGRPLPPGVAARAGPGLRVAIAKAPNADLEQRARAAEPASASGALEAEALAEIYGAFEFTAEELDNAISTGDLLPGPRGRALLYQAARAQSLPATRAEVLRIALERAEADGLYQAAVPVFLPLLSEIPIQPELAWFAATAGRAYYAAGRFEQASAWLTLGRQEALINPQAAAAAATLWPYSRLAGGAALTTEGSLAAWRAAREGMGDDGLAPRQALLRASFQALGEPDPLPWSTLAADGAPATRPLPDAALLYALEEASESRRIGETVLLALVLLGQSGPAESHTVALGAVLSALSRVGLEAEARAIAIEAALASGV